MIFQEPLNPLGCEQRYMSIGQILEPVTIAETCYATAEALGVVLGETGHLHLVLGVVPRKIDGEILTRGFFLVIREPETFIGRHPQCQVIEVE